TNGKVHVGHRLKGGRLAVGYSWDIFCEQGLSPATEGEMEVRAGLMFSSDGGRHWVAGGDISARPAKLTPHAVNGMDEPATVILENGEVYSLLRTGTDHLWGKPQPELGRKLVGAGAESACGAQCSGGPVAAARLGRGGNGMEPIAQGSLAPGCGHLAGRLSIVVAAQGHRRYGRSAGVVSHGDAGPPGCDRGAVAAGPAGAERPRDPLRT